MTAEQQQPVSGTPDSSASLPESGTPDKPRRRKTLKSVLFDLIEQHGAHEVFERAGEIAHEQSGITSGADSQNWAEVCANLERAQAAAEVAPPIQ